MKCENVVVSSLTETREIIMAARCVRIVTWTPCLQLGLATHGRYTAQNL
jgi:hypothetical protein